MVSTDSTSAEDTFDRESWSRFLSSDCWAGGSSNFYNRSAFHCLKSQKKAEIVSGPVVSDIGSRIRSKLPDNPESQVLLDFESVS